MLRTIKCRATMRSPTSKWRHNFSRRFSMGTSMLTKQSLLVPVWPKRGTSATWCSSRIKMEALHICILSLDTRRAPNAENFLSNMGMSMLHQTISMGLPRWYRSSQVLMQWAQTILATRGVLCFLRMTFKSTKHPMFLSRLGIWV